MKDSSKFKIHVRIMLFVFTAMFVGLIVYLAYSVISIGSDRVRKILSRCSPVTLAKSGFVE